jgi:hypothetical protein
MAKWKRISFKISMLFLAAWVLTPSTVSAQGVPAKAGAFAAYCTPLKEDCSSKIEDAQVAALAGAASDVCSVPDGITADEGARAIVGWLSAHPANANMSTEDGINAAIKALWNCQKSVATGHTSRGVPDNTGVFVTFCDDATHYVPCANEVVQASVNADMALQVNGKSAHCSSPDKVETKELTDKVLAWLKDHKELYGQKTEDSTAIAIDHLWPCH